MRSDPNFDTLKEKLLRAGIAPRRIRRYLAELEDHLAELTARETKAGFDAAEAATRARALLGRDDDLAAAWLTDPRLKSFTARAPWLVFVVLPPIALLLSAFIQVMLFILLAHFSGGLGPHGVAVPQRLLQVAAVMEVFANFIAVPALALLFVLWSLRQRLPLGWPVLSTVLIAGMSLHWDIAPWHLGPQGWAVAGVSYRAGASVIRFGITPILLQTWWQALPTHGATLGLQYLLTFLLPAWLLRARRRTAA